MFDFDTTEGGGSKGPWVRWTADGSAKKGLPPKSFALRGKDENDASFERVFDGFAKGVVVNLDTVQQGWQRDNGHGQAPTREWSKTPTRPDDSKTASGKFAWSRMFGCRIAIGGGEMATWEDASWGGYEGFRRLAVQIKEQAPGNPGKCPVVKLTGIEEKRFNGGSSCIPIVQIVQWIDPPACFAEDGEGFDTTEQTPASTQAAPQPVETPAPANDAVPEDMAF
jgi:hypothetical protein